LNYILDACAMLAYLKGEPGALIVDSLLRNTTATCYAHAINLCEVYYDFLRHSEERIAKQALFDLYTDGVIERQDMGRQFWHRVGQHKARGGISLADCFCIALAQYLKGEVVTSDHREFDSLVPLGLCPINFIR
jgi:PIN domain nuclease of toxin-antitoxin system